MASGVPPIPPDDGSSLTPDFHPSALVPNSDAPVPEPDVRRLGSAVAGSLGARGVALLGLFVLGVLYTLHFARAFILPVVLAILLDFLLSPVVRLLKRAKIPEPVGAAIVMLGLLGTLVYAGYRLAGPAADWLARAPESFERIEAKLQELQGPVEQVTQAAEEVQDATTVGGEDAPEVQIAGPSLTRRLFGGTTSFVAALMLVVFLTYFLLAAGDLFLQKLIKVLPQFKDKKTAVSIARETEAHISTYLFTATLINLGVGVVTAIAMTLVGMPNPVLWGVVAAVLNFVPYLGATVNIAILALAAMLAFESTSRAMIPPAVFFGINLIEGNVVSPMILGQRMRLNTVALFVGLMFWWYLWGIPGAILAVPMMAVIKIVCDHIETLAPIGEFLGK